MSSQHARDFIIVDPIIIKPDEAFPIDDPRAHRIAKLAYNLVPQGNTFLDAATMAELLAAPVSRMKPVHSESNPLLIDSNHMVLLWEDPEYPDYYPAMVAMVFELEARGDGSFKKTPVRMILGSECQVVIPYRFPCCGENDDNKDKALSAIVAMDDGTDEESIRLKVTIGDTVSTKSAKQQFFKNIIQISDAEIEHMHNHLVKPGFECGHDHHGHGHHHPTPR